MEHGVQGCVLAPPPCSTYSSRRLYTWYKRFSRRTKTSWTPWCTLEENGGGGAGGSNHRRTRPSDVAIVRAAEEDDGRDRGHVRSVWLHHIEGQTLDPVFAHEGDAGGHRHIQRRGSRPGIQPNERVRIPRGERQPQCRPVYRGRSTRTQRMVQLPEVHPRTVRPTERSPRA